MGSIGFLPPEADDDIVDGDQPGARVRRLRRAGARASSRTSSPRTPGWSRPRCPATCSIDEPAPLVGRRAPPHGRDYDMLRLMPRRPRDELTLADLPATRLGEGCWSMDRTPCRSTATPSSGARGRSGSRSGCRARRTRRPRCSPGSGSTSSRRSWVCLGRAGTHRRVAGQIERAGWVFARRDADGIDPDEQFGNLWEHLAPWSPSGWSSAARHSLRDRRELEADPRELPGVLPLLRDPPGALQGDPARQRVLDRHPRPLRRRPDGPLRRRRDDVARWPVGRRADPRPARAPTARGGLLRRLPEPA